MQKIITVTIKSVYGTDVVYPMDRDSKVFAAIAGTKTLTKDTLRHIKALGYTIVIEQLRTEDLL